MIKPPREWKPLVSLKPMIESNHCRMARTSVLPNYACLDFCRKIQESFSGDSIRRQPIEKRDWKYKFKTGELVTIPLSNIMTQPFENEARIVDKKLNNCKLTHRESDTISNGDEGLALTKSAKISRHVSNDRFPDNSKQYCSYILTLPLSRNSVITFSSQTNRDQYGSILRENVRYARRSNTENHFRTSSSEISKPKFPDNFKSLKVPFSSQAINIKLKRNLRYKVNASELPRSKTPLNEKDPDKINFKNVASFLSDDLGSCSSVDDNEGLDFGTGATETANNIPGSDTPSEEFFDFCCYQNSSSPKLSENAEAMNLVSADIFTSPPRSVHSSGAFKTSFRLRRAPKHGMKTKREKDSRDAASQNDSKPRLKLQRFLDFGVSIRERTMYKDGFYSGNRSKEFLQVPSEHAGLEKQLSYAGSDTFVNGQHPNKCQVEMREVNTAKILSEKDCKRSAEASKSHQHTFAHFDKKVYCKKNFIEKSKSDLAGVTVKDQTCSPQEKGAKSPENGTTSKYGHSVVIIPACTPLANDGGNSSDSEIISELADQATADNRCSRTSNSANFNCKTAAPLYSNQSFASNMNASTFSVFSQRKQETTQRRRNQSRMLTAKDEPEEIVASKLKDCSPVKLTFRKKITSRKNTEFLSKFLNSIKNDQKNDFVVDMKTPLQNTTWTRPSSINTDAEK